MQSNGGIIAASEASKYPVPHRRVGTGGGRDRGGLFRLAGRPQQHHRLRHGRHHREGRADRERRGAASRPGQELGDRASTCRGCLQGGGYFVGCGDRRSGGSRRGRRLDRAARRRRRSKVGPQSAGAVSGADLLRPGRRPRSRSPTPTCCSTASRPNISSADECGSTCRARARIVQEQAWRSPLGISEEALRRHRRGRQCQHAQDAAYRLGRAGLRPAGLLPDCHLAASGPVHAVELAEDLGIARSDRPARAGPAVEPGPARRPTSATTSAAPTWRPWRRPPMPELADADRRAPARRRTRARGLPDRRPSIIEFALAADMRYRGQAYEINVALPDTSRPRVPARRSARRFTRRTSACTAARHARWRRAVRQSHADCDRHACAPCTIRGFPTRPKSRADRRAPAPGSAARPFDDCPMLRPRRTACRPSLAGPAIVAGQDSTMVVPPGWIARLRPLRQPA